MRGLIIVDVQKDFCEGGALPVHGGTAVAEAVGRLLTSDHPYDHVVATRDWHIDPGTHFSDTPDFVMSWPPHCRAETAGAALHPALADSTIDAVFSKGGYDPGYSGMEGVDAAGTALPQWLRERRVDAVDVVGLATDHCVRATAEGAARAGFTTRVLIDLTAGIAPASTAAALDAMRAAGVEVVDSVTTNVERELLAAVEQSPRAAAAHDRTGWVGLFTADGRVEDPVGSRPHVGTAQISRFYDTFIGPRDIVFHRDLDIVDESVVIRDLELEVAMGSAVTMHIPAFLRYDMRADSGQFKIASLQAYWELPAMVGQFLRNGTRAVRPMRQLSTGLYRNQGIGGAVGFMTGFRRPGFRSHKVVQAFLRAVARDDLATAQQALSEQAQITVGDTRACGLPGLAAQLTGADWTKMIGAGSTVVVSVISDAGRGVLFSEMSARSQRIDRIRYFAHP